MTEAGDAAAGAAASPSSGGQLAEARQAQNLTPAEVARQLKLSVCQVEALEAGRFEQLPGPIFVRGFIRNYARLLKLDPNELLREAGESIAQSSPRTIVAPSPDIPFPGASRSRWPMLAGAVVGVVGALAAYEFYWNEPDPQPAQAVAAAAPVPESAQAPVPAPARPQPAVAAETPAVLPVITLATTVQATQDASPVTASEKQQEAEKAPRPGERQLKLAFDQESWVEIRDRNERVIFSQLNRAGTQQFVNGLPPFSVVVGNAHGVRMIYGDKPVDLASHTKIDVARLILQ